jgi:DNA mismatch repair protein MutL
MTCLSAAETTGSLREIQSSRRGRNEEVRPAVDGISAAVMSRIQRLSPSVVNKIAAGEVVERPASVVKELLENSLDALAARIEVDIQAGGAELIRVVDDGEGIEPDDLPLAVASHATSKISAAEDLFRVQTMGFRGEALASVAEVSWLTIRSRREGSPLGAELTVAFGAGAPAQPCGCPQGTSIEVRGLFENTPVRRKFLKNVATEFGHIAEQFTRVALAQSRLQMALRHNGKPVFDLPPTAGLLDRLRLVFGDELAEQLIWVESEHQGTRMSGYVGLPSLSRTTRKQQYVFLNGRCIQDRTLQHALTEAYRGLLMVGRQPVAFLAIDLPPDQVDVNVHPTKVEVRFQDSQQLYRQLLGMLRKRFLAMDLQSPLRVPAFAAAGTPVVTGPATLPQLTFPAMPAISPERQRAVQADFAEWAQSQLSAWTPPSAAENAAWEAAVSAKLEEEEQRQAPWGENPSQENPPGEAPAAQGVREARAVRALQVHDCYLVIETETGLTVIDQHALHERILYEHLRERILEGTLESQRLLLPITVELSARETAALVANREILEQLGFSVEEFGQGTVLVTRHPVLLGRTGLMELIKELAERLDSGERAPTRRDILDELLHLMSCKAAVKAGQRLTAEEIDSLLQQRHFVDDAHHCPHGRPTALTLSRAELDRQFGRLG